MDMLIENENQIIRNLAPVEDFIEDSLEYIPLGVNVAAVTGIKNIQGLVESRIDPDRRSVQSIRFEKPDWTLESALMWVQENYEQFNTYEKVKKFNNLRNIEGVEIFSAGTWNGDAYTVSDLDEMVEAFDATYNTVRPPIKLGHDDDQKILQNSGLPAAGWIGRVYRRGEKLLADFVDIPGKIYELIERKAYRKVSCEVYFDISIKDNRYNKLIGAVALLGAETPGVMNLADILAQYGFKGYDKVKIYGNDFRTKVYDFENKPGDLNMPTEKEIKLQAELDAAKAQNEKLEAQKEEFSKKDGELEKLANENAELEKKVFEAEQKAAKEEIERKADSLVNEKLMPVGMKEFAIQLLSDEPETKKYNLGEDKEGDKFELLKKFCEGLKATSKVNFDNNSEGGKEANSEVNSTEEVRKFAKENDLSISDAYRELNRGKLNPTTTVDTDIEDED